MNPATTEFLRQRFTEYYKKSVLVSPPSLEQREWGFVLFNPGSAEMRMRRHIGFSGREELLQYIKNLVPQHSYYSTAYYEKPDAGTMAEKGWCGADLIFDLDADHIVRGQPYDQMLARVKEETEKLLAMLIDEMGIESKTLEVVFSGGRGYHIHVKDIAFRGWGSSERRELIDYVCGIGIDPAAMLSGKITTSSGWPMRFRKTLKEYLDWLGTLPEADALTHLTGLEGIGKESAATFLKKRGDFLVEIERHPTGMILKNRVIHTVTSLQVGEFKTRLLAKAALADEPVTTDTKRLIRMPTSLHGGSGMRVQPLELRDINDFDPLVDAVVFGEREVKVDLRISLTMPMLGSTYELQKGITTVPEAVAVFLCCRGLAEIA
jgi:DNA primase small subunit